AETRKVLTDAVDRYLVRFAAKRDPTAILRLQATRTALAEGLDLRGLSAYDIPMISFKNLLDDFKQRKLSALGKEGSVQLWDETIVKSIPRFVADAGPVRDLKSDEAAALAQVNTADAEIQAAIDGLSGIDNRINSVLQDIGARRQAAKEAVDAEEKRLKAAGDIEAAGKVAQLVAVTIGTFFPATAPIALSVGAGMAVSSKAIANHNRGQALTLQEAAVSFEDMIELQNKYTAQLTRLRQAWTGQAESADPVAKLGLKAAGSAALQHVRSGFRNDANAIPQASSAARRFLD